MPPKADAEDYNRVRFADRDAHTQNFLRNINRRAVRFDDLYQNLPCTPEPVGIKIRPDCSGSTVSPNARPSHRALAASG